MIAGSILVAVLLVMSLRDEHTKVQARNVRYAIAISEAALNAKGIAHNERGFLMTGDTKFTRKLERRIDDARAAFAAATRASDGVAELRAVSEARAGFERWVRALRSNLKAFRSGADGAAIAASLGPGRALRRDYERSLARAQALAASAIESRTRSIEAASSRSVAILLASLVVAVVVGLGVAVWLTRAVLRPMYGLLTLFSEAARASPDSPDSMEP